MKRNTFWALFYVLIMIVVGLCSCSTTTNYKIRTINLGSSTDNAYETLSIKQLDKMYVVGDTISKTWNETQVVVSMAK